MKNNKNLKNITYSIKINEKGKATNIILEKKIGRNK